MTQDSLSGTGGTAPAPDRPVPPPTGRYGEHGADTGPGRPNAASGPGVGSGTGAGTASGTAAGVGSGTAPGRRSAVDSGPGPADVPGTSGGGHVPGSASGRGPADGAGNPPGTATAFGSDGGAGAGPGAPRQRLRAWAELLRVSALFSVPGDALAGAAAVGRRPGRGTALAIGASLCLYEAGMALNDWADRDEDAVDRPHRPIPSGRISPAAALGAAGLLTAAGLALAARAGRPALTVATGLAATVWAYDLRLKHTKAGPAAMAAARSLDLLLGAAATATPPPSAGATVTAGRAPGGRRTGDRAAGAPAPASGNALPPPTAPTASAPVLPDTSAPPGLAALPAALVLGAHTYGVTAVSRHETTGGSTRTPLAVLATTTALAAAVLGEWRRESPGDPAAATADSARARHATTISPAAAGTAPRVAARLVRAVGPAASPRPAALPGRTVADSTRLLTLTFTGAYLRTAGPPLLHAVLNPSPPLTQRAVGGGIRAMIPLQAVLAARAGSPVTSLAVMALVPLARSLARKVSLT
ncbi:SCO3242 family prenyltransferase [Streptomyces sp. NPDC007117]|uniref:SCO3242 family prenyltransferase n=1 Tax=Streptomyces sp. NPDC007117 TaxID=3154314 RepID=UPI0033D515C3